MPKQNSNFESSEEEDNIEKDLEVESDINHEDSPQIPIAPNTNGRGIIVATVIAYLISLLSLGFESTKGNVFVLIGLTFILFLVSIYINKKPFTELGGTLNFGAILVYVQFQFWGFIKEHDDANFKKYENSSMHRIIYIVFKKLYLREIMISIFFVASIALVPLFGLSGLALIGSLIYYRRKRNEVLKQIEREKK